MAGNWWIAVFLTIFCRNRCDINKIDILSIIRFVPYFHRNLSVVIYQVCSNDVLSDLLEAIVKIYLYIFVVWVILCSEYRHTKHLIKNLCKLITLKLRFQLIFVFKILTGTKIPDSLFKNEIYIYFYLVSHTISLNV